MQQSIIKEMSRIVAQPCNLDGEPGINFNETVAKKVQLLRAEYSLSKSEYSDLEQIYLDGWCRVWGVTPNNESRWNKISYGDVVLFSNGTEGVFSKRIVDDDKQMCIGALDKYIAVCRKCYLEKEDDV